MSSVISVNAVACFGVGSRQAYKSRVPYEDDLNIDWDEHAKSETDALDKWVCGGVVQKGMGEVKKVSKEKVFSRCVVIEWDESGMRG